MATMVSVTLMVAGIPDHDGPSSTASGEVK